MQNLCNDLASPQMPHEPHLARGAEDAAHGAPHLGADARGEASGVAHDYRLDGLPIVEPEQKLAC